MELAGNRPEATRKQFYQAGGIFNSANVAPPPYSKTAIRKRSELLGTRQDSYSSEELSESDAYG